MLTVSFQFSDIWIVGDSLVSRADEWAASAHRHNLYLDPQRWCIRWLGKGSMTWQDLRSKIQWIGLHATPKIILIHLGGNDVVFTKMQKMKRIMQRDFNHLFRLFPQTLIVWSEILPRLKWKYAPPTSPWKCWDRKRLRFNQLGRQLVSVHPNGRVLKHDVTVDCPGLFATDGCHMSPVGNALFCNSLQGGIEAFIHTAVQVFES